MLVLSRFRNEGVWIEVPPSDKPTRIHVVVVDIRGDGKARLGFDAPRESTIHRDEIQREVDSGIGPNGERNTLAGQSANTNQQQ